MPTARELLEQADALMRRNRTDDFEPDIPELTDEVAVAAPVREAPKASPSVPRVSRRPRDGVPELDSDVGAVEDLSIRSATDHEGEDSRWLDADLGEASVTGPAPDSIAVVPPSTLRSARVAPSGDAPRLPVAEIVEASSPPPSVAADTLAAKGIDTLSGQPAVSPPASDPRFEAMLGATPADDAAEPEEAPPPAAPPSLPDEVAMPATFVAPDTEPTLAPVAEAPIPVPVAEAPMPAPEAAMAPVHPVVAEVPVAAETVAAKFPDALRWEGLAEEIRMQVLQRIDIFTDTGLHGELSARLQPIVDRASADLVTTINREVGQILRAYVAEAIEREIEKWREANP
jgi:hypothetical protein